MLADPILTLILGGLAIVLELAILASVAAHAALRQRPLGVLALQAGLAVALWSFLLAEWPWLAGGMPVAPARLIPLLPLGFALLYGRSARRGPEEVELEVRGLVTGIELAVALVALDAGLLTGSPLLPLLIMLGFFLPIATGGASRKIMEEGYSLIRVAWFLPAALLTTVLVALVIYGTGALAIAVIPDALVEAYHDFVAWLEPAGIYFSLTMIVLTFVVYPLYRLWQRLRR